MPDSNYTPLAPWAVPPHGSRGRAHPEPPDPLRNVFDVDRHRILSSAAFRRLECKTQVFVTDQDDHYRTRLTHTLEAAEIARRLGDALGANAALAEVITLAHDLGHPPFGHAGETALRDLMRDHGGFEHNTQSLRVVDYLEHPYPAFRGLNLSFEVREGLIRHETLYDRPGESPSLQGVPAELLSAGCTPTAEAQITCVADRLAYDCHDLEDAIGAGLLAEGDLAGVSLWAQSAAPVRAAHPDAPLAAIRRPVLDRMLNALLTDVIAESRRRIEAIGPTCVDDVRNAPQAVIGFSPNMEARLEEHERFLLERVYRHPRLARMDARARRFIDRIFRAYLDNPRTLPRRFARRIDEQGMHRVVCDYVAGMTDRFCQKDYKRLFEPFEGE